jgi:hypothetical protein
MTEHLLDDPPTNRGPLVIGVLVVVVAALGGWYFWSRHAAPAVQAPMIAPPAAPAPEAGAEAKIEHPLPSAAGTSTAPLPDLNDSDKPLSAALDEAAGGATWVSYLVPESIIRHIVVTVDNLPRQKVAADKRPIKAAPGPFVATGDELHATLDAENFQRYAPLIEVLRKADMQRLAAVYMRFYPLFQQAYQGLGYPNGYFNDRLVQVIDVLLATPQITDRIDLARPNVMYVFADQALESRPAGQKVLIRMGPDNAAVVKAKLGELRAIITAAPPKQ